MMKFIWLGIGTLVLVAGGLLYWNTLSQPETVSVSSERSEAFFEASNVRVNYENGQWWLRLETPEPVLCAVNLGVLQGELATLSAMDMTAPAQYHDIALNVIEGRSYQVILTAFTPAHDMLRSKTYLVSAQAVDDPEQDLIGQREGRAVSLEPQPADRILISAIRVDEVEASSATVNFASKVPTLASTAFGPTTSLGRSARVSRTAPFNAHNVALLALEAETRYYVDVLLIDEKANVYRSQMVQFETPPAIVETRSQFGPNVALLSKAARIKEVSGNWAGGNNDSAFGANNAIDGDPTSEWSSDGEGNDAWIEIELSKPTEISGVGFWTRTMTTSAEISRFRVVSENGSVLGEFDLPDAKQLYRFSISPISVQALRFEVVGSSGGNTGARSIEIYQTP